MLEFVRKMTVKHGKPVIMKSPFNTGRIRYLLELFPGAKFVNIHRHPFDVFKSSIHTVNKVLPPFTLQRRPRDSDQQIHDGIISMYREVTDAFFDERALIPEGHFIEIGYAELVADRMGGLRKIYEHLGLPDFGAVEPKVRAYLESLGDFKKNKFNDLDEAVKARLTKEWSRAFEQWGYAIP